MIRKLLILYRYFRLKSYKRNRYLKFRKSLCWGFPHKVQNFIIKIKRSIRWARLMFENRNFDSIYLLWVMKYKLEDMLNFFKSGDTSVESAPITAIQIQQAIYYLELIIDNESELYSRFDHRLYDKRDCDNCRRFKSHINEKNQWVSGDCGLCFDNWADIYKQEDIRKREEKLREAEKEQFFSFVKENFEDWWD